MPEPLPRVRRTIPTATGTTNSAYTSTTPWTTARCHRLLRPLASKLQALKNIIQSNPSVTILNAYRPKPKRDPRDPDALFVEVVEKAGGGSGVGVGGARTRSKPRRTYSGGSRSNSRPPPPATVAATNTNDEPASIWGSFTSIESSTILDLNPPPPAKRPQPKPQDPNNPLALLNSLKSVLHPSIFSIYLGIYTSLESVLLSTNSSPTIPNPLPLRTLAARKIAHCILATTSEVDSDDIWYDAAAELGCGGEYLREVVRWHAIELVREATAEGFMDSREGGLGMAGVLIGLCRTTGAEPEAQSLLQTLFDLNPVISSTTNPAIQTLNTFFAATPEVMYRFLASNFPSTRSNPSWLGSTDIREYLLLASEDIDANPGIEVLAVRALEAAFGVWGEEHISALVTQRREAAKRKGGRRAAKSYDDAEEAARRKGEKAASVMPYNIAAKAEHTVLKTIKALVLLALKNPDSKATDVLQRLVKGFLAQDPEVRSSTEDVWGERYPVAAKVAILLQGIGRSAEDDSGIMDEIARCIEDICSSRGKEGLKSLAGFVADCYMPLYTARQKSFSRARKDELQHLANRLLSLAARPISYLSSKMEESTLAHTPPKTPQTVPKRRMVTFTPGKPDLAPDQEASEMKRYLVAQLALQIAVHFSLIDAVKSDVGWISWLGRFEHKVIGLKIQTPGRVKHILQLPDLEDGLQQSVKVKKKKGTERPKGRKGWRYEEGLDLWVSVGATPGRPVRDTKDKKKGVFMGGVVVEIDEEDESWRDEYEAFDNDTQSSDESDDVMDDEDLSSEYEETTKDRPVTPDRTTCSSLSSDDDDEFYSNIRTTPPRTLRRSPRNTARIRKSLASFSVILSSPVFARLRTPAQQRPSALRKSFDLSMIEQSSSPAGVPSTEHKFGSGDWDDEEGERVPDSSPVMRREARRRFEYSADEGSDDEDMGDEEEELKGDIPTLSLVGVVVDSPRCVSTPPSKRKRGMSVPLADLMDEDVPDAQVVGGWNEEEEEEIELEDKEYQSPDDELTRIASIPLPPSPPPPPTPPPIPRRPKRTSLGALKSMVNINDNTAALPSSPPKDDLIMTEKQQRRRHRNRNKRKRAKLAKSWEEKHSGRVSSDDELAM